MTFILPVCKSARLFIRQSFNLPIINQIPQTISRPGSHIDQLLVYYHFLHLFSQWLTSSSKFLSVILKQFPPVSSSFPLSFPERESHTQFGACTELLACRGGRAVVEEAVAPCILTGKLDRSPPVTPSHRGKGRQCHNRQHIRPNFPAFPTKSGVA